MATDSPGAWALWFLMLGIYSIVTITFLFLGTICAALVTVHLRGKPTLAFRLTEDGKEIMVYVYNDEHWLVHAVADHLVARKTRVEDLEAQNEQPGVLNENLEDIPRP
ncbi:hypothetical protein IFM58399_02003 [Aspergillus lentulus]|uniref:Uncharacterized protein n=1 Tax=Aspergillus lentulus TaxID=293939 RepID=A0ABQ0ZWV7_ASPLE|nr:uncharacterized protein IFM58399_02003 [Aspergillus lentulus]KAF4161130.1 hypothetical protein CNMCM6069_006093 [Aspergillus lentulus]KAF4182110.1 hypothetical protein CNMCM8060_007474 [Aspergillus lentulus]KAF4199175.1 hypothetical protein CNMCM8694_006021 [Aspergillus lentulus]GFF28527.1 hypothetical protein IFM58399_02003 [Aspergillus lentulus]GFF49276.1 hypothetical protein IFM62136_01234 [Aspergillus lentulus]